MPDTEELRDLIYFDVEKASSLLSQFKEGLPTEITESEEASGSATGRLSGSLGMIGGEIGGSNTSREGRVQKKILHHDILRRIEDLLFSHEFALDLNKAAEGTDVDGEVLRELIEGVGYVRAEGSVSIEDYNRLQQLAGRFEFIADFINRNNRYTLKQSEEYQKQKNKIEDLKSQIEEIDDRNERARMNKVVDSKEKKISQIIEGLSETVEKPEEWILEGIRKWVDIFNPNQTHLRLSPFPSNQSIELISNLKEDCLFDDNKRHMIFSYGGRPNLDLTMIGLVTSVPSKKESSFSPSELARDKKDDAEGFELAFKNMFGALDNLDSFSEFSNYPNIKVYPIAVYRKIENYADA